MRRAAPLLIDVQDDRPVCPFANSGNGLARHRLALAVRAAARADRPLPAGPVRDQPGGRRAAASDPAVRRPGHRRACQRVRPLSGQQGPRRVRRRGRGLARPPLRPAAPGRSGQRSAGAQRHPRGTFSRSARRQELGDAARGHAGRAHSQSVLCGLCGRRDRRRLRAGLSADHARDRLPARPRCARRRAAWRARWRSISPRRPIRRAPSPTAIISSA